MTSSTRALALSAALLAALLSTPDASAQIWNAADQYSATQNPNGAWTYLWSDALDGTYNTCTFFSTSVCNILPGWNGDLGPYNHPTITKNQDAVTNCCHTFRMPPDRLLMHPGPGGEFAILRWTAPNAGDYHVTVDFAGVDYAFPTSTDVTVLKNGVALYSDFVEDFHGPSSCGDSSYTVGLQWSSTLTLAAGDTIDFAVGYGSNHTYNGDSTLVHPTITSVGQAVSVGAPCGAPAVLSATAPIVGQGLTLSIAGGPSSAPGGLWVSPVPAAPTPIAGGCLLHLDPAFLAFALPLATDAGGDWSLTGLVPPDVSLIGLPVALQAHLKPSTLVLTNGLELTF